MKDASDTPRYHGFRMRWIFPFAFILNIVMFVQSISDAMTLSYIYLIDAVASLCWFSLAVPTYTGFKRRGKNAYRWNVAYEIFMLIYLSCKELLYIILFRERSIGLLLFMALFILAHIWEAIWYHGRQSIFTNI